MWHIHKKYIKNYLNSRGCIRLAECFSDVQRVFLVSGYKCIAKRIHTHTTAYWAVEVVIHCSNFE